jgi:hypothetical protein
MLEVALFGGLLYSKPRAPRPLLAHFVTSLPRNNLSLSERSGYHTPQQIIARLQRLNNP